jgi:hypothetical protein
MPYTARMATGEAEPVIPGVQRVRRAYICEAKGCAPPDGVPHRTFLLPGEQGPPECPEHPGRPMALQSNRPYSGKTKGG